MVTHYPSVAISCTEVAPYSAQVSQVTVSDSRYAYSESAILGLKNLHIVSEHKLFYYLLVLRYMEYMVSH